MKPITAHIILTVMIDRLLALSASSDGVVVSWSSKVSSVAASTSLIYCI